MKITIHKFEHTDRAKDAVALLKEHIPSDWTISEINVDVFNGDVNVTITIPYSNASNDVVWNISKLLDLCNLQAINGCRVLVTEDGNFTKVIFNRVLPGKISMSVYIQKVDTRKLAIVF